jgi:hypothetical protein
MSPTNEKRIHSLLGCKMKKLLHWYSLLSTDYNSPTFKFIGRSTQNVISYTVLWMQNIHVVLSRQCGLCISNIWEWTYTQKQLLPSRSFGDVSGAKFGTACPCVTNQVDGVRTQTISWVDSIYIHLTNVVGLKVGSPGVVSVNFYGNS